jgi:hypothetical protein
VVRTADAPSVFISHASANAEVAAAVVRLLRTGLRLSSSRIRCTSVDGNRLPVGVNTAAMLRKEIRAASVFISILTPTSVRSSYVLFELGARWGAGRFTAPVIARGLPFSQLPAPLDQINVLDLANASQVCQLLENVAAHLGIRVEPPPALEDVIASVVNVAAMRDVVALGMATPNELLELHMSAERRLAKALVEYGQKGGSLDGPYWRFEHRISHQELSLVVGTTRPRITAFMQRFQQLGIVDQSGGALRVHREKALELLLER